MLARFPRIELNDDGFDFFPSVFICYGVPNRMDQISIFMLEWKIDFFVACFYPMQDIAISLIIAAFYSMDP